MNSEIAKFMVYFRDGEEYHCMNSSNSTKFIVSYKDIYNITNNICSFAMLSGYNLTRRGLAKFKKILDSGIGN